MFETHAGINAFTLMFRACRYAPFSNARHYPQKKTTRTQVVLPLVCDSEASLDGIAACDTCICSASAHLFVHVNRRYAHHRYAHENREMFFSMA